MYRIQLATGLDAIYRSIEELAVSVQNGIVCPDALIYHRKTGSWLPIEAHPHYHVARDLVLPENMGPVRVRLDQPASTKPPTTGKPRLKREAAPLRPSAPTPTPTPDNRGTQRSDSSWLMAAAVSGLATFGWFLNSSEAVDSSLTGMVVAGMEAPVSNALALSGPQPAEVELPPDEPSRAEKAMTYDDEYDHARRQFEKSISTLGLEDLFAPSRIGTPDGLRTGRRLLAAVRNIVAVYRGDEVRIDQAFGMANASKRESYGTARSVDSLIAATDSIYALLQATDGQYRLRGGRIAFEDQRATAAYLGQAIWLEARLRDWNRNPARTPMTIRPIVAAVIRVPRSQTGF